MRVVGRGKGAGKRFQRGVATAVVARKQGWYWYSQVTDSARGDVHLLHAFLRTMGGKKKKSKNRPTKTTKPKPKKPVYHQKMGGGS